MRSTLAKRTLTLHIFSLRINVLNCVTFDWANKSNIGKLTAIKQLIKNHCFKINAFCNNIDKKQLGFMTKLREEQIQQMLGISFPGYCPQPSAHVGKRFFGIAI
jgi:hypothetical protein